jgi:hypothetical protein
MAKTRLDDLNFCGINDATALPATTFFSPAYFSHAPFPTMRVRISGHGAGSAILPYIPACGYGIIAEKRYRTGIAARFAPALRGNRYGGIAAGQHTGGRRHALIYRHPDGCVTQGGAALQGDKQGRL